MSILLKLADFSVQNQNLERITKKLSKAGLEGSIRPAFGCSNTFLYD